MRKNILVALLFSFYSSIAFANPACFSNNEKLGDSAYWSITAIELFDQKRYEDAVAVVDLCFDIWGPEAQKIQKESLLEINKSVKKSLEVEKNQSNILVFDLRKKEKKYIVKIGLKITLILYE